jgi:DNA (cytosine-5)-methyltransferase 1
MIYRYDKKLLVPVLPSQVEEVLTSFKGCKIGRKYISIDFEDHNYKCMSYLESVMDSKVQALSFFSGCGGLDIGAQMAGAKILTSLDFDKDAVNTLSHNEFFSHTIHRCDDIRNVKGKDYSSILKRNNPEKLILVGGPPCQPFSKAGYWKTLSQRLGPDDPRNMIGSYLNIIDEIKPDGFILENVESILHPHNIQAIYDLQEALDTMGYKYIIQKVNAADYGIPQKRKRVFVIASKKKIKNLPIPICSGDPNNTGLRPYERVIDWIGIYDRSEFSSELDSTEGKYDKHLKLVPPGSNYISLSARRGYENPYFTAGTRYWTFLLKLHPLLTSWTIISAPGHWEGPFHWTNRRLRSEEIASIQTFPTDYQILGSPRVIHKQVGNAVPCLLGKQMIECLIKNL